MTLEGDMVDDPPINNGIESHYSDSQCFPEAQTEKNKKKKSQKNKDSVTINDAQTDLIIDSQCNPEAECPHPKRKKKRLKDKDASVDIYADTSKFQDDSIGPNSCSNNNSLESHNTDSQCNPEAEYPQPKKKKSKKRLKDKHALIDIHVGESHNTDSQSNLEAEYPQPKKKKSKKRLKGKDALTDVHAGKSQNTDSQFNPEAEYPQPKKKKRKKRLKDKDALTDIHASTSMQTDDSIGTKSCHDSLAEINAHRESKTAALSVLSRNHNSLESHSIDSQCNSEGEYLKQKKKKRKSKVKDKGSLIDLPEDTSVVMGNSIRTNSCHDSLAKNSFEPQNGDSQCIPAAECPKPKKKKKSKLRDEDASVDFHADTSKLKDDSVGTDSCRDSLVETISQTDSLNKRKKKRKKQRLDSSGITDEDHASPADLDLTVTEENALISEKQCNSPGSPGAGIVNKRNGDAAPSVVEKENIKKKRKKQKLDSSVIYDIAHRPHADRDVVGIVRDDKKNDSRCSSINMVEEHTKNDDCAIILNGNENVKKKKKRDKEKLNASVILEKAHVSPSVVEKENIKKKRKKQKLDSSVIYDNAHHPHVDRDVVGIGRDGKKNDLRCSSINMVEEHNNNDDGAFILNGNENVKKKRKRDKEKLNASVILEKGHVSPEDLDRPDEKNSFMFVKEIDSQSTPSSNQGVAHIEGEWRSYGRKRRKSPDPKENMQPTAVAGEVTSNSEEIHSTKFSNNEVEGVQDGKVAASSNALADMNYFDYSNVDFPCPESKDMIEIKKSSYLNVSIEKNNLHQLVHPPVGAHVEYANKKLLILDVNGLLADVVPYTDRKYKHDIVVSKKYVFKRPFCDNFLQFCFEKFNVGVWSSRLKTNLDKIVNFLMPDSQHKLLFCWDQSHCTNTGFTTTNYSSKPLFLKELKKLWDKLEPGLPWNKGEFNESNTLLLDDSPYKALSNPANTAIFPHSYDHKNTEDSSLGPGGDLRVYLERLAEAPNIQEYVARNPFGQKALTELNDFHQKVLRSVLGVESSVKIASSSEPS